MTPRLSIFDLNITKLQDSGKKEDIVICHLLQLFAVNDDLGGMDFDGGSESWNWCERIELLVPPPPPPPNALEEQE